MKVAFSDLAKGDLDGIVDWIASDNPQRAISFAEELVAKCLSLSRYPRRFPEIRQVKGQSVRKLVWHGYVVLFPLSVDGVEIVRIVQGARNWAALLDANDPDSD